MNSITKSEKKSREGSKFGIDLQKETQLGRYYDDDFVMGDVGFALYSDKNVAKIQRTFSDLMRNKHNYNIKLQPVGEIENILHEMFWGTHEKMFLRKRIRVMATIQEETVGYKWDPNVSVKNGCLDRKRKMPSVGDPRERKEEMTVAEVVDLVSLATISRMEEIALDKIASYKYYHKMYNRTVLESLQPTGFANRSKDVATNRMKRGESIGHFAANPKVFGEKIRYNY